MLYRRALPILAAVLMITVGACRADEEAAQHIDEPDPRIEQAPATPIPPVGVPPVGSPGAVQRMDPDTLPRQPYDPDTPAVLPRVP